MGNNLTVRASMPSKLRPIAESIRYKILYGGRGGGKSHSIATQIIINGASDKLRILCSREIQKSIKQSVHQLLSDTIQRLDLGWFYTVLDNVIRGKNGTEITFAGLSSNTVESIKSFEGVDICWIEEGQTVTERSWEILIPTIRKKGSEIWVSFNPFLQTDNTYIRFVLNPPSDSLVIKVNYDDNPWFGDELEAERLHSLATDPERYKNIWEGECLAASDMQYITTDSVVEAMDRAPIYIGDDPLICGVDLARGGNDDCVISFRRGKDAKSEKTYTISGDQSRDSMRVIALLGNIFKDHQPDQINVDEGGLGAPIVDRMNQMGWNVTGINFGSNAMDSRHYGNRGAEMWGLMREWINTGGALRKDTRLLSELTCREFHHDNKSRIMLESKKELKKRGAPSPDKADALCLTFAVPMGSIVRGSRDNIAGQRQKKHWDEDPLDRSF